MKKNIFFKIKLPKTCFFLKEKLTKRQSNFGILVRADIKRSDTKFCYEQILS